MENPAIQTNGLTRLFGALAAVDDVTLSVAPGQFFGFLGPNGAGKSTTIKMLTGLLEPSSGTIEILGQRFGPEARELKRQIGVVPEGMALLGRLTAPEYLHFVGRMYGLNAATTNERTEELLEFMQLAGEHRKLVTDFSHGMQKKLAMAAAVIHGPKVLFLDEPFEGVDAIAAGMLKTMLTGMINRGATIFLTTHVLEIVERLCSHVAIISKGRLVATGSIDELRAGVASALPGVEQGQRFTLEEIFLAILGSRRSPGVDAGTFMAGVTGVGVSGAGGGMLGREARTQYAAMAQMRWRMFMNGLRSIHGLLDLGATGIAWIFYSILGLGLGAGLCAAAYSLASRASWQYLPILFWAISFLWLMFPMAVASFQEQSDLGILLRFPVHFGSYFLLYLISGLMEASTIIGGLCCLGVWLGIVMARPDLYLWAMLGLSVFAVFNILLVRAVFAWIDRWLAQRKTREILGAVFMVLCREPAGDQFSVEPEAL